MSPIQRGTTMADVVAAHLALDATRVEATATAHAATARDLIEQRIEP